MQLFVKSLYVINAYIIMVQLKSYILQLLNDVSVNLHQDNYFRVMGITDIY